MELHYEQSRSLAELRDMLLPKLSSGQLRVPAATIGQDLRQELQDGYKTKNPVNLAVGLVQYLMQSLSDSL